MRMRGFQGINLRKLRTKIWKNPELYDIIFMLSYQTWQQEEVFSMEVVIAFLVAVAAGVACHYIIKWLDGGHKDNE